MKVIRCVICGDIAGVYNTPFVKRRFAGTCPGKGNHKATITKKKRWLGRTEVWHRYHDTGTYSHYFEWNGGKTITLLLALLITPQHRLYDVIEEKWVFGW